MTLIQSKNNIYFMTYCDQRANFASPAAASLALVFRKHDHRGPK